MEVRCACETVKIQLSWRASGKTCISLQRPDEFSSNETDEQKLEIDPFDLITASSSAAAISASLALPFATVR